MTPPVIPPAHRTCSRATTVRPSRTPGDGPPHGAPACTTTTRAFRTVIPFGRDGAGMPVSWDLSAGRNLLIARDERLAPPSVSLDLAAMSVLSGGTHDVIVLDPHRRHRWLIELGPGQSSSARTAATPEDMTRVVTDLVSTPGTQPRMLLVSDLAATVAALDHRTRALLTEAAVTARERRLTIVATTADPNPRWFPEHLIDAFDDVVEPQAVPGRYREPRLWAR
ncbi:hypothetical protein ACIBED_18460 [Rhodococcus coprophilus]|uniref:hypothetical protein n=1 Tax=Rhodococcus coprophilus TaxID=38310 RepID=UPI0037B15BAA